MGPRGRREDWGELRYSLYPGDMGDVSPSFAWYEDDDDHVNMTPSRILYILE